MSTATRPPSVILRDMARVLEAQSIIHRNSFTHEALRTLIEECQNAILIRDRETTEILQQAIRDAARPSCYGLGDEFTRLNPNDHLGANRE